MQITKPQQAQAGFSLAVTLVVTIVFAGIVAVVTQLNSDASDDRRIASVAWQVEQIGKAARLYVRNNSITQYMEDANSDDVFDTIRNSAYITANSITDQGGAVDDGIVDNVFEKSSLDVNLGNTPIEFTVDDLITAGYLPPNFGLTNNAGNHVTVLGQRIRLFAANSPIDGDSGLDTTVASAYLLLEDSPLSTYKDMITLSRALQAMDISIAAPLFGSNGTTNISDDCTTGNPAISIWDTGCLTETDFETLLSDGDADFAPGNLVVPVWKTAPHDERAIMRFPQPENPGFATMLTDLKMGPNLDADSDGVCDSTIQVVVEDDVNIGETELVDSNLCQTVSDIAAGPTDNRFHIYNVSTLEAERIIATNQGGPAANQDVLTLMDLNGGVAVGALSTGEDGVTIDTADLDGDSNNLDTNDVAVFNGMTVSGDMQIFNETDNYAFANAGLYPRAYFHDGTAATNLDGANGLYVTNEDTADVAHLYVDIFDASGMQVTSNYFGLDADLSSRESTGSNADYDDGLQTTEIGLSSSGTAQNQDDLSTFNVSINGNVTLQGANEDDDANKTGFTVNTLANAGQITTINADFLGMSTLDQLSIVGTGTILSTGYSAIIGDFDISTGTSINNATIDSDLVTNGSSNYNGDLSISQAYGSSRPDLSGGTGGDPIITD